MFLIMKTPPVVLKILNFNPELNDPIVCIYVSFCTLSLFLFSVLYICSVLIFNEVYVTTCILVFWWYEPTNRNTFWQANTHYQVLQKMWLWENPFVLAYLGLGQHGPIKLSQMFIFSISLLHNKQSFQAIQMKFYQWIISSILYTTGSNYCTQNSHSTFCD